MASKNIKTFFADAKAVAESLGWELLCHHGAGTALDYELKKGGVSARFHRRTAACTAWSVTVDGVELVDWRENAIILLPSPAYHPLDEVVRRAAPLLDPVRILKIVLAYREKEMCDLTARADDARFARNDVAAALCKRTTLTTNGLEVTHGS